MKGRGIVTGTRSGWQQEGAEAGSQGRKPDQVQGTEGAGNSDSICTILKDVICAQTYKVCWSVLDLIYGHCFHSNILGQTQFQR